MLPPSQELQHLGVVDKSIVPAPPADQPLYWSKHRWAFSDEEGSGDITLRFSKLEQNGQTILQSFESLGLIDALAGVPAFGPNITNEEAAAMALNPPDTLTYQRPLIKERIEGIIFAFKEPRFIHTGCVTVHVPPEHIESGRIAVVHDGTEVLMTFKMKELLLPIGNEYVDVNTRTGADHRPLHLLDGQHRVAASGLDAFMLGFPVCIKVLPIGSTYADAAKTFTDLNVGQEPPKELHQLYQRYICRMPHREPKLDFGDPSEVEGQRRNIRHANRSAYRLALELARSRNSPLTGRIQVMELPGRRLGRGTVITTKKFVSFAKSWYRDSGVFKKRPFAETLRAFQRYLFAWEEVVNVTSQGEAWQLPHRRGVEGPYITQKFPFEAVMGLFPLVWKFALEKSNAPSLENFQAVLKPLEAIDFGDFATLRKAYGLTSQTPKALHAWFSWAISRHQQTGTLHDAEEVWNSNNRLASLCRPGKGFFSPPDADIIEAEAEWETIAPGASMELWVSPYPNAHLPAVLSVKYLNKQGQVIDSYTETGKHVGLGHTHLKHDLYPSVNLADALEFQVIIQNQHGEAQLQKKVSLSDLRANEDGSLDLGKARSVTAAMQALPEPTDEVDEEGVEATEENDQEEAYLTVVKIDNETLVPPAGPNKYPKPTKKTDFLPPRARIVQCPRCSMGLDCSNAQCIGKSVEGYVWGW
jgi:hypothetical protein